MHIWTAVYRIWSEEMIFCDFPHRSCMHHRFLSDSAVYWIYSLFIQSRCAGVRSDWALWSCVHRRRASFAFDLKDPLTRQTIRQWVASSRSEQWHEPSRTTRLQHVYPYTLTWAKGSIRTRCTKQERWPSSWRIELQISWQPADKM